MTIDMKAPDVELLLIRQIFDEAQQQLSASLAAARLLAVLHLDLCVELALSLVVRYSSPSQQPSKWTPRQDLLRHELWKDADTALAALHGTGLPHARELRTLHEMRNLAQHTGTIPSAESIQRAVAPVREFLGVVYLKLFDQDFNRFCMWHLVSCPPLRTLFKDIEEALQLSMPTVAITGCRQAHKRIVSALREITDGFVALRQFGPLREDPRDRAIRETTNALAATMNSMRAMLIIAGIGMGVEETLRFDRSSSGLGMQESISGHLSVTIIRPKDPERLAEDAEFMFGYVVRLTLLLEQAYPGIFANVVIPLRLRDQPLWKEVSTKTAGRQ
jgi:hypothetical protein